MTTTAPAVSARGVGRRLGSTQALQDVSFDLPTGAVCGLLGRNGAGKTTLMAMVAGHDRPDAGEITVHGERPFENPAAAGLVSMVRDNQRYPDDLHLAHLLRVGPLFHAGWDADLAAEVGSHLPWEQLPAMTDSASRDAAVVAADDAGSLELVLLVESYDEESAEAAGLDAARTALSRAGLLEGSTSIDQVVVKDAYAF